MPRAFNAGISRLADRKMKMVSVVLDDVKATSGQYGRGVDFGEPYAQTPVLPLAEAILPGSSTPLEKALAATDNRILAIDADVVRRVTRPDECAADQLHILAWEYSVDEWDPAWDEERKRAVIKASFEVHRHK